MSTFLIIGTPIGNLNDITFRALSSIKMCDIILCEDTRRTSALLNHFEISGKKLVKFDKFVENRDFSGLLKKFEDQKYIGFVTDAGMPGISDPGGLLVSYLRENNIKYEIIPGVSSLTTAIAGFGLPESEFYFGGFLPRKKSQIKELFNKLARLKVVGIFFESPNRLEDTLNIINEEYPGIKTGVARELTKIHEQFIVGKALELIEELTSNNQFRGEVVLMVDFTSIEEEKEAISQENALENILNEYNEHLSKRDNAKILAKRYGLSSSEVYKILTSKK
jgi:16S rRNA (cytidine1402-2'-O)-methyltransferase